MGRIIILWLLIFTLGSCIAQHKDNELVLSISGNINSIDLSKLHFFSKELVQLGTDSSFLLRLKKQVGIYDKMNRKTIGDNREYQITLYQLYTKIGNQEVLNPKERKSQEALLKLFKKGEQLDFSVDDSLILQQIDYNRRSMVNGYDEGTIEESMCIFFCYNPILYKRVLLKSGATDRWQRLGIFLCNHLRENGNPMEIRYPLRERILAMISAKEIRNEFVDVIKEVKNCDVSSNLFD